MATTNLLKRESVAAGPDAELNVLENAVLKEAEQRLRYGGARSAGRQLQTTQKVAKVFAAAQVQPFTEESVRRYKWRAVAKDVAKWLGIAAVGAGLVAGAAAWTFAWGETAWSAVPALLTIALALVTVFTGRFAVMDRPRWDTIPLDSYVQPVPTFALMTALALQRAADANGLSCGFYVDRLLGRADVRQERLDPFLVMRTEDGALHYIEVWDEPSFTQERKV